MKKKKFITIKDWYILPPWGRGLAIGAMIGSVLMIPSAFLVKSYLTIPIPFAIFIACSLTGTLITRNRKDFGLRHRA